MKDLKATTYGWVIFYRDLMRKSTHSLPGDLGWEIKALRARHGRWENEMKTFPEFKYPEREARFSSLVELTESGDERKTNPPMATG